MRVPLTLTASCVLLAFPLPAFPLAAAQQAGGGSERLVDATIELEPGRTEVGEPFRATLVVRHPSARIITLGADRKADESYLELDRSWVLFDEGGTATRPDPERPGRALTTRSFVLASLEPGARELPPMAVDYTLADVAHRFLAEPATIEVVSVLGPEEDAPRPLPDFRDVPEPPTQPVAWLLRALLVLGVLALAGWAVRALRRPRAAAPEAPPKPSAALARAAAETRLEDPEAARALHYTITRELRRGVEQRVARSLSTGLTDDEWLERIQPQLAGGVPSDTASALRALFEDCAGVKYGHARPTPFAIRETLERAAGLCAALEHEDAADPAPAAIEAQGARS